MEMKKARAIIYGLLAATALSFASCDLETSSAGDFDGMWHLTRVDTIATGGVLDLSRQRIFWSFQFKLMEADDKDGFHHSVLMRYDKSGGTLKLNSPYVYNREEGDKPLDEPSLLKPFGINNIEEEFKVLKVDGSKMQLQSSMLKLSFRKF